MMSVLILLAAVSITAIIAGVVAVRLKNSRKGTTRETLSNMDIHIPVGRGRHPVIFLAHNGFVQKDAWEDFPDELADKGYAVVNMGWTEFEGGEDFRRNIDVVMDRYGKRVNFMRAAFIGGCHGGIKILAAMEKKLPCMPKALVFLSMSEKYPAPARHAPILGMYSIRDHLGDEYIETQKAVYERVLTEPKMVIPLDATPHGNELVTDSTTKTHVRDGIRIWLKKHL